MPQPAPTSVLTVRAPDQTSQVRDGVGDAAGGALQDDEFDAHFGMTREDVIQQMQCAARDGRRGKYLPADFKFGLELQNVMAK